MARPHGSHDKGVFPVQFRRAEGAVGRFAVVGQWIISEIFQNHGIDFHLPGGRTETAFLVPFVLRGTDAPLHLVVKFLEGGIAQRLQLPAVECLVVFPRPVLSEGHAESAEEAEIGFCLPRGRNGLLSGKKGLRFQPAGTVAAGVQAGAFGVVRGGGGDIVGQLRRGSHVDVLYNQQIQSLESLFHNFRMPGAQHGIVGHVDQRPHAVGAFAKDGPPDHGGMRAVEGGWDFCTDALLEFEHFHAGLPGPHAETIRSQRSGVCFRREHGTGIIAHFRAWPVKEELSAPDIEIAGN